MLVIFPRDLKARGFRSYIELINYHVSHYGKFEFANTYDLYCHAGEYFKYQTTTLN